MNHQEEWNKIHRRAYRDGWTNDPLPDAPIRGILLALCISGLVWTAALVIGLWS